MAFLSDNQRAPRAEGKTGLTLVCRTHEDELRSWGSAPLRHPHPASQCLRQDAVRRTGGRVCKSLDRHRRIWMALIVYGCSYLQICLLTKMSRNLKISPHSPFVVVHRVVNSLSCPTLTFSIEVKLGHVLSSCFSSHTINRCPVCGLFKAAVSGSLWVIALFKKAPKHSAEVLTYVLICLMEKTRIS